VGLKRGWEKRKGEIGGFRGESGDGTVWKPCEIVLKEGGQLKPVRVRNMAIEHLKAENFNSVVSSGMVVVDFWAEWCGPCRMMGPVFDELSNEMDGVKFAKVNITESQDLAQKFGVMSIPTLVLFKDGKEVDRMMGAIPKGMLKNWIENKSKL
jgi:thioredoxin 1